MCFFSCLFYQEKLQNEVKISNVPKEVIQNLEVDIAIIC